VILPIRCFHLIGKRSRRANHRSISWIARRFRLSPRDRRAKGADGEDAWNTRDPARVALAYTSDSRWRNRAEFFQGCEAIEAFLTRKWLRELDYRSSRKSGLSRESHRRALRL